MFTKNAFTQTDAIADLIKGINEADYKAKMEALKGNQHKIDKNKNNKVDADDFKILRGEKKVNEEQVEEDTSVKIPTATGTRVLGHRYGNAAKTHRDSMADPFAIVKGPKEKDLGDLEKKMTKKEEIDPTVKTKETLKGVSAGTSANPFLKPKVKLNVNEEELDEAIDDNLHPAGAALLKHIKPQHHNLYKPHLAQGTFTGSYKDRTDVLNAAKQAGHLKEESELNEANKESEKDFQDRQKRLAAAGAETAKDPARLKRMSAIPGYTAAMDLAKKTTTKEEVEQVDERTLTKGETAEKERIVKGMKKSLAGFKARYGEKAKSVMYATATKAAKKD
jgi:hypothetical protein